MIAKILIANRGEIAARVIKTAREMGIATVAVASDSDKDAYHTHCADQVVIIGGDTAATSYLDQDKIIAAARETGADAIHPGYGFLSENPEFVDAVEAAGITFIGPTSDAIRAMGLKDKAKQLMQKAGVPVVPGYDGADQDDKTLNSAAAEIGFPVMIKARAGGGGKGMRRVDHAHDFIDALNATRREAAASFGDDHVLIEKCITSPRHIEVQIFADTHGNIVHLFERDCTLQRRHQKVIEEAPAPGMTAETRAAMTEAAIKAAAAINYRGAGTVEFIVDGTGDLRPDGFWFMEMNTRLQVEHPVTEAITGFDLVSWQITVANGDPLPAQQDEIAICGHAVEARIYAEDAAAGFLPAPGVINHVAFPKDIRVDHGVNNRDYISPFYDPMIAKMISQASSRDDAINALANGLAATQITGTITNTSFLSALVQHPDVATMAIDTTWIDRNLTQLVNIMIPDNDEMALIALAHYAADGGFDGRSGWRMWGDSTTRIQFIINDDIALLKLTRHRDNSASLSHNNHVLTLTDITHKDGVITYRHHGKQGMIEYYADRDHICLNINHRPFRINRIDPLAVDIDASSGHTINAPMTGMITVIECNDSDVVKKGDVLVRMEAMKMEHPLTAPCNGVVESIHYELGDTISDGSIIVTITPAEDQTHNDT